jgi:hypothetical protein
MNINVQFPCQLELSQCYLKTAQYDLGIELASEIHKKHIEKEIILKPE